MCNTRRDDIFEELILLPLVESNEGKRMNNRTTLNSRVTQLLAMTCTAEKVREYCKKRRPQ
jgi:hypothetical protein